MYSNNKQYEYMKLTQTALDRIKDKRVRALLALALNVTDQSIVNYIGANKDNGPLTTAIALRLMTEEIDLSEEEILEEVPA